MKNSLRTLIIPMYLLLCFASMFCVSTLQAQKIVQVGAGEYFTSYRTDNGSLFATKWGNNNTPAIYNTGLSNVVDVEGAQYTNVALTADGSVYVIGVSSSVNAYANLVATDNLGNPFKGNTKVYGMYQCYLSLRNGTVWYWGVGDVLNMRSGANITAPIQLTQPAGKTIVKLVNASATTFGSLTYLWGLASDGTVWQWDRTHPTPFQVTFAGGSIAQDIAMVGCYAFVIKTANDLLTWGYYPSYAGGVPAWQQAGIQSIKQAWLNAGCVFPLKEIVGNYNTLHVIDANNNMFAAGSNPQGEIGNAIEYPTWKTLSPLPWNWDWSNGQMMTAPTQIPGKFKNIQTSNTITFYLYVQDMGDNWYSWGRNKSLCLGNGQTLSINDYAIYPDALICPAPTLVTPLTQTWQVLSFNPNGNQLPMANAGINQYINSSSTTLFGSGSSQQGGTITSYSWQKLSGGAASIANPNTMNANVTDLTNGTYTFKLTITNNYGVSASSTVTIVSGGGGVVANIPPTANAGGDATIVLPVNSVTLNGTASDPDGSIVSYQWTKLSGPAAGTFTNANTANAGLSGLVQGTYVIEFKVTDNAGATASSNKTITVDATPPPPPPTLTLLPAVNPANTVNGIDYKYFEGTWSLLPAFNTLVAVKSGVANNFDISLANKADNFGFSFTGYINVPADGEYTFYTTSDDGSKLFIDNIEVVNNDGLHAAIEKSGKIGLKAGKHVITALFFENVGGQVFNVSYQSVTLAKQAIPNSALYRANGIITLLPAVNPANTITGLDYKYYEGTWSLLPAFNTLTPVKTGVSNNFDITLANSADNFGFTFTGFITVPADGEYTFYTTSDDGSKLYIDNIQVVDNDGLHGAIEKSGKIGLKAGKHAIYGIFFEKTGGQIFTVSYEGMGIVKQKVPNNVLSSLNAVNLLPASNPTNIVSGLDYKYYEGTWSNLPVFNSLSPVKTGTANNFDVTVATNQDNFGLTFTGFINVPLDGEYTFYTNSDDGSKLFIDNVEVVDNDGQHAAREKSGKIGLMAGKHAISGIFFENAGDQIFTVSYEGMGVGKQLVPATALYRSEVAGIASAITSNNITEADSITSAQPVVTTKIQNGVDILETGANAISVYPNPFVGSFKVQINNTAVGDFVLKLSTQSGQTVFFKKIKKSTAVYSEMINVSKFTSGVYILQIINVANGNQTVHKVIKN